MIDEDAFLVAAGFALGMAFAQFLEWFDRKKNRPEAETWFDRDTDDDDQ